MRRADLSDTQRRVLDAIAEAYLEHGQLLDADQLAAATGTDVDGVKKALDDLEHAGMLTKLSHTKE